MFACFDGEDNDWDFEDLRDDAEQISGSLGDDGIIYYITRSHDTWESIIEAVSLALSAATFQFSPGTSPS